MKFTPAKMSLFRKVAQGMWRSSGDPSVYGLVDVDVTDIKDLKSPLSLVVKTIAHVMEKNPELNAIRRWGKIYLRKDINVSVMVNLPQDLKQGLSFSTLHNVDQMTIHLINEKIFSNATQIRAHRDPVLGTVFKLAKLIPQFLIRTVLNLYSFVIYELKLSLKPLNLPNEPFGAVIVSNVGSLGIKHALLPLVPLTRAPMMIAVGQVGDEARVHNGAIVARRILHLGITFDHRVFDGEQASRMLKDFQQFIAQPSST